MDTNLLAIDIGNTHTVVGLYSGRRLRHTWRIRTDRGTTSDELGALLGQILGLYGHSLAGIGDMAIASVVPSLQETWVQVCRAFCHAEPLVINASTPCGMHFKCKDAAQLGADRVANAVAGFALGRGGIIVVDYGTATTFDCVTDDGAYIGGCISPGLLSAAESMALKTAKLPLLERLSAPESALAQDTTSAMEAGLVFGFAGLTDGIIHRLFRHFQSRPVVLATGGLAALVVPHCAEIHEIVPDLTLEGIAEIWRRVKSGGGSDQLLLGQ